MTERIIDISVLPFTHEMKATRYEESEALKQGFIASGVWERELIAVASKQPNVYIGADSIFPGDWSPDLVAYMCNTSPQEVMAGREKVLFGSNYPALSGSPDIPALVETIDGLGLDEATMTHLMGANARRVYRL